MQTDERHQRRLNASWLNLTSGRCFKPFTSGNVTADTELGGLDIVQLAQGVPTYSQLADDAVESDVLGVPVRVCSLERLREMKQAQGRTQDQADLENLPE